MAFATLAECTRGRRHGHTSSFSRMSHERLLRHVKQMGQEAALSPPFDAIVLFDVLVDRLLVSWVVHSMSPLQLGRFNLSPIETVITLR